MLDVQLAPLLGPAPAGLDDAVTVVAGLDATLVHGFGRLGAEQADALNALAGAVAGTSLAQVVDDAVAKTLAGSVADDQLAALAGARTALFGAVHDALIARFDTAAGRTRSEFTEPAADTDGQHDNLRGGCRAWLRELAIAGWHGVDHDLAATADQLVEGLLPHPELRRLGVLLDGFAAELRASFPIAAMDRVPARRWADLWARAQLLAQPGDRAAEPVRTVSGRLLILGADVHEHGSAVQVQVHGVLEDAPVPSLVRVGIGAAKVDTITGPSLWRLLARFPVLLTALAQRRCLELTDMPLLAGGDLVWHDDRATPGEPAEPFTTARVRLAAARSPAVAPLERHPVRIAEPVLLEGYTVTDEGALSFGTSAIPVDFARLPACGPLTPELVRASHACIGLLRWDGRWTVQPIAVQATVKRKPVDVHTGDWALGPTDPKIVKAEARAGDPVAVLRERAGRLLRG